MVLDYTLRYIQSRFDLNRKKGKNKKTGVPHLKVKKHKCKKGGKK